VKQRPTPESRKMLSLGAPILGGMDALTKQLAQGANHA